MIVYQIKNTGYESIKMLVNDDFSGTGVVRMQV